MNCQVSQLEDLSAQQTSSNFALTVEIESLKERQDEIIGEKENLENQIERTSFSHAEEKIKMESTLAQQTKLIDFLQKKVMVDDRNFAPASKKKEKVYICFVLSLGFFFRVIFVVFCLYSGLTHFYISNLCLGPFMDTQGYFPFSISNFLYVDLFFSWSLTKSN